MSTVGSVVLSIDAELGWGFHDLESPPTDRVENARRGWNTLLDLLERYSVPATWAVVGHLMLADCDGEHADHPAPPGWFDRERTTWADRPDLRFGPELIEAVLESPVEHELASHSYSHVLFGDSRTTRTLADAELERAVGLASQWGLELTSFVYPRNDVGHREALADHGFRTYRGKNPHLEGMYRILESAIVDRSLLVRPSIDEYGLVDIPASLFLFGFEGRYRRLLESVWGDPMVRTACRGIDQAVDGDDDQVCHLWLHPNNLTGPRDDERMAAILAYLEQQRQETDLRVETMAEIGERCIGTRPSLKSTVS
ncbi:polysaccharide deacetylase family protein [Halobacteria archaeon AArc-curdl1]|uniref:Polysaccharide deacetylase family protein n=1 Tax=Natronosalvus hydrolyticus TaxID=2979988 RepID=A0AAP2ZEA9_9EURY|nr:polysaccharide deacetylase family protein [Halobacteria archaeon AArc-curdl1]